MNRDEMNSILAEHQKWLNTHGKEGRRTDLRGADLRGADLKGADLEGADLDFSAFPLWCGGLSVHIDDRIAIQLLFHLVQNTQFSKNTSEHVKKIICTKELIDLANKFHREDVKRIKYKEGLDLQAV